MTSVVAGACGGKPFPVDSTTPPVTANPSSALQLGLVTADELTAVPGLESAVTVPASQGQLFEDPDPRAPCGAKLKSPKLDDAVGEFQTASGFGFEGLGNIGSAAAKRFLKLNRADMRPGCPAYESHTNQPGALQRVVYEGEVEVPSLPDDALVVRERITAGQQTVDAFAVTIRRSGVLAIFVYFGERLSDVDIVQVSNLVDTAVQRVA